MKPLRTFLAASAAALAMLVVAAPAQADGRWHGGGHAWRDGGGARWHGSIFLGFAAPYPYYWGPGYWGPGYYYGPPAYYVPPIVAAPAAPPVYVERDDATPESAPAPSKPVWWYWCPTAKGYYPYVKECPGGWQRVPPQQ